MKQTNFNFKSQFVMAVESGAKTTTIRLFQKTTPPIQITEDSIRLGKRRLTQVEEYGLAKADGFGDARELRAFFRTAYGFPLHGKPHWVSWH